jgi:site-specific DNA-methyltransferase (adenine-specific)
MIEQIRLHEGDCLVVLAGMAEDSVDAVVTDPPYELGFMGKSWDASGIAFSADTWRQVLRVMKPGAHLVAFGAPKNYHRLACAIEDAGFEIRDSLMWVFGTGFPKSLNVGEGRGTALKPAYEPIVLARKPLSEKTVAANVLRWGTGALNIDATRIEMEASDRAAYEDKRRSFGGTKSNDGKTITFNASPVLSPEELIERSSKGRWPANLCHDGSQEVLDLFPHTKSGTLTPDMDIKASTGWAGGSQANRVKNTFTSNEGSAARFFYSAKASKTDRAGSKHPTVKPISLMQWLVRLVTPPNGTVLDLFAGSGTTGQAAINEGFNAILIEREAEYINDIKNRLTLEIKEAV